MLYENTNQIMQYCLSKNITTVKAIKEECAHQMMEIENKVKEIDNQKQNLIKSFEILKQMIKQFGGTESLYNKKIIAVVTTKYADLTPQLKACVSEILSKYKTEISVPVQQFTNSIFDSEKRKNIILALKWLQDKKILHRKDSLMIKNEGKELENDQ